MKKALLLFSVLCICVCLSIFFTNQKTELESDTLQIELITGNNRHKIGKEILSQAAPEVSNENDFYPLSVDGLESCVADIEIPENPFYTSIASSLCHPGNSVQEIVTHDNMVPEIIIPNGAVGVFSKGDLSGWSCNAGCILSWSFEKYPMDSGIAQTLGVGYIKDGIMYEMEAFKESLDGTYHLSVQEDGIYHIYVIGLSSDPISLKGSDIQMM